MNTVVYRNGLGCCSVCTTLTDKKKIADEVNTINPTGIGSKWRVSKDTHFASGEENGCPCNEQPETHRHFLLEC